VSAYLDFPMAAVTRRPVTRQSGLLRKQPEAFAEREGKTRATRAKSSSTAKLSR
jgi:hypothetical protein